MFFAGSHITIYYDMVVPAPCAIALLGLAGLVVARRRSSSPSLIPRRTRTPSDKTQQGQRRSTAALSLSPSM
jgi:xanthosine utilization system XapX-like protein